MTEREKILTRIREALSAKAALPEQLNGRLRHDSTVTDPSRTRDLLPFVGESFDEQVAQFRENAVALKADFRLIISQNELARQLIELRDAGSWQKIASHEGELTNTVCRALNLPVCRTDQAYDVHELESCDAGITECDALVAQFGSVLVTSRSAGGRALSVLPPHHVVLARREQLLRDLPAAFELLNKKYGANYPSMISFITGPSRTGDIERILVLGAHGPKNLTILLVRE